MVERWRRRSGLVGGCVWRRRRLDWFRFRLRLGFRKYIMWVWVLGLWAKRKWAKKNTNEVEMRKEKNWAWARILKLRKKIRSIILIVTRRKSIN